MTKVRFSDDSIARPDEVREVGEAMKGRPLSENAFVELLVAVPKLLPANSGGIVIALDRDGDDTGIQLEFRILPRRDSTVDSSVEFRRHEMVVVDGKAAWDSSASTTGFGGHHTSNAWDASDWKTLLSPLRTALESPPEKQFQVRAESTRGR